MEGMEGQHMDPSAAWSRARCLVASVVLGKAVGIPFPRPTRVPTLQCCVNERGITNKQVTERHLVIVVTWFDLVISYTSRTFVQ